jgi:sugar lactone lactonase YvrE
MGIAVDGAGNVYVAEFANNIIRKISPQGSVLTLAGSADDPGWLDGDGDNAHFRNPWALALDKSGNIYVADKDNFVIRKVTPDGRVSTFAGKPGESGFHDGPADSALFKDPRGVAVDSSGNVYVADTANNAVRKISAAGDVSTIAISLSNPDGIAVDASGTVYVIDAAGVHRVSNSRVDMIPPLALTPNLDGPFGTATAIAVDARGTIYLSDTVKDIILWQPGKREAK